MSDEGQIPEDILQAASTAHADYARSSVTDNLTVIIAKAVLAERENAAAIAEQVRIPEDTPGFRTARLAVTIAARAIRRGRHLTAAEKLQNIQNWLASEEIA